MSNQMRRLMRRMGGGVNQTTPGGLYLPQGAWSPRDEQDRRRDHLAEQVLLEMVQYLEWEDSEETTQNEAACRALRVAAHASIAAAEVIYPDLPSEPLGVSQPLLAAAQEGAQSVGGFPEPSTGGVVTRQAASRGEG